MTKAQRFLELHRKGEPLLMPNAWDAGSGRLLASLGFEALASTSSGFAATLGRLDYGVTQEEAIRHGAELAAAVDVPVSADLENCFADEPAGVADTIRLAIDAGLAGGSVEDFTGNREDPIYELGLARERVAAAVEAAGNRFVVTARAEDYLHGRRELPATIARLQAFQDAGAHALFAPGWSKADDIRAIVTAVDLPVSVLVRVGVPTVAELAEIGVARVSVGGSLAYVGLGAVVEAATELRDHGTYGYSDLAVTGGQAAKIAFS